MTSDRTLIIRPGSDEWSCDHSSNSKITRQHLPCNLAVFIQLFHWNNLFMRCNLTYAVCRCIHDQGTRLLMLLPIIVDNLCSGIRQIAQNLPPCPLREFLYELFWKSFREFRKWIRCHDARHLPMPGCCIFSAGQFLHSRKASLWCYRTVRIIHPVDLIDTDSFHVRNMKLSAVITGLPCIAPNISKRFRIRCFPDARTV